MASFFEELIANNFSKFAGLAIAGTVPLRQDLINEALGELVQGWSAPRESRKSGLSAAPFLPLVKKVAVRAENGVVYVDFEIRA